MALRFSLKDVFTIHSNWYGSLFMTLLCLEDFQYCNWWDVLSSLWEQTRLSAYMNEFDMKVPDRPSIGQSCRSLGSHFNLGWNNNLQLSAPQYNYVALGGRKLVRGLSWDIIYDLDAGLASSFSRDTYFLWWQGCFFFSTRLLPSMTPLTSWRMLWFR